MIPKNHFANEFHIFRSENSKIIHSLHILSTTLFIISYILIFPIVFCFLFFILFYTLLPNGVHRITNKSYFLLNTSLSIKRFQALNLNSRFYYVDTIRNNFSLKDFKSENSIYKIYQYQQLFFMPFIFSKLFFINFHFFFLSMVKYFNVPTHLRYMNSSKVIFKVLYDSFLYYLVKNSPCKRIYSFDKDDRYSISTFSCINQHKKLYIVIPHGLEYGFQLPSGVAGHRFYCLTEDSLEFHKKTYSKTKFIFSKSLVIRLFKHKIYNVKCSRLIFFPESREIVNNLFCLEVLEKFADSNSIKLYVSPLSHHKKHYSKYRILDDKKITTDDIIFCRKSTLLFEYAISGLQVFALLFNSKDREFFNLFPSLKHSNIHPINSKNDLTMEKLIC